MENPLPVSVVNKKVEEKEKKKGSSGSLPFMMFAEVDGNVPSVLPDCPNASNPYHKCGKYCWDKIGSKNKDLGSFGGHTKPADHDVGGKRSTVVSDGVHPSCAYASNPYHQCSTSCYKRMSMEEHENRNSGSKAYDGEKAHHQSRTKNYASTSSGTKSLSDMENGTASQAVPKNESRGKKKATETRILYPDCVYASNPFHECTDRCRQKIAEGDQPKKSLSGANTMEKKKTRWKLAVKLMKPNCDTDVDHTHRAGTKKKHMNIERWNVHPDCIYASNPYHTCVEKCFQRIQDMSFTKQDPSKKDNILAGQSDADPKCQYTSNPFHKCTDSCFQKNYDSGVTERVETKKGSDKHSAQLESTVTDSGNTPENRFQMHDEEEKIVEESSGEEESNCSMSVM